jgi:hypothetical protein
MTVSMAVAGPWYFEPILGLNVSYAVHPQQDHRLALLAQFCGLGHEQIAPAKSDSPGGRAGRQVLEEPAPRMNTLPVDADIEDGRIHSCSPLSSADRRASSASSTRCVHCFVERNPGFASGSRPRRAAKSNNMFVRPFHSNGARPW